MKASGKCPKCGCTHVVGDISVKTGFAFNLFRNTKPENLLDKRPVEVSTTVYACTDCGFAEMYADYPRKLR